MAEADDRAAITRELLALPLDEFTAERNSRARELKASGAGALAAEIQQLRRPALPLWAANQLARQPEVLSPIREVTAAATDAQARGSADDLREALARLQRALDGAADAAASILEVAGHRATEDTRLRVRELVRIAALRDDDWERLTAGVLTEEPLDVGFGMLPAGTPRPSPAPARAPASKGREAAVRRARAAHEAAVSEARRQAADDAEAAERAIKLAARRRKQADDLAAQARSADERATAAEDEARRAQDAARTSQDALAKLSAGGGRRPAELPRASLRCSSGSRAVRPCDSPQCPEC